MTNYSQYFKQQNIILSDDLIERGNSFPGSLRSFHATSERGEREQSHFDCRHQNFLTW